MTHACVLVVDDRPQSRAQIRARLEGRGYRTVEAADGIEGLEIFEEQRPDAVVTDVRMPRSDGIDLLEQIRSRSEIPVFCITAFPELDTGLLAVKRGAEYYYRWPHELERLITDLDETLREPYQAADIVQGTRDTLSEIRVRGQRREAARRRDLISRALRQTGGNVGQAAERLGISRRTLYHWIDRYGVKPGS